MRGIIEKAFYSLNDGSISSIYMGPAIPARR